MHTSMRLLRRSARQFHETVRPSWEYRTLVTQAQRRRATTVSNEGLKGMSTGGVTVVDHFYE